MKRRATVLASAMLLSVGLWAQGTGQNYREARVVQASDIVFPAASAVTGIVTLGVSVDATGTLQNVTVIRDVAPLTAAAQTGLQNWKFSPAMKNGKSVAGNVGVQVVFNPFNPGDTGIGGGRGASGAGGNGSSGDFQLAQLQTANYAQYPVHTVASGTVVVLVRVDASGKVQDAKVIRGSGPLADAATRATKGWGFAPATYRGNAVPSVVPVAFVFAPPAMGDTIGKQGCEDVPTCKSSP
jgi:TonB family protein